MITEAVNKAIAENYATREDFYGGRYIQKLQLSGTT